MVRVWSSSSSALLIVSLVLVSFTFATRPGRNRNSSNRSRNRQDGSSHQTTSSQYRMICPSVVCQPLPDTCQTSEYIVMEIPYTTDSGQRAEVRCESCEYCLDYPSDARRTRRSVHRPRHLDCSRVVCPDVTSNCTDSRQTDVLLGNVICKQCPACYDDTVFSRT